MHTQLPGWSRWVRTIEMAESKSAALPLGYAPILAVSVGLEPTDAFTSPVFKTGVIDQLYQLTNGGAYRTRTRDLLRDREAR